MGMSDRLISYLPLAHSMEQCSFGYTQIFGGQYNFYGGDPLALIDDCQLIKPTVFSSVPRLYNKVYDKIMLGIKQQPEKKQNMFNNALDTKKDSLRNKCSYTHPIWDKLIFSKIRARLGGKVKLMITGSAPISIDVLEFLKCCFCCPVLEGYGQTETSGVATATLPTDPVSGHVGGPLGCLKIRLRDVPDMNYFHTDLPCPRGEIQFKGPSVFNGYFKDVEKTNEAFSSDGWLCSGDVGLIRKDGSVKVIDRAKNIFKLSQGEYIAPEKLENIYI
jgi:long-chain acyl-CoA synthetase